MPAIIGAGAGAIALAGALTSALALALAGAIAIALAAALSVALAGAGAFVGAIALAFAVAFSFAGAVAAAIAVAVVVAIAITNVIAFAVDYLGEKQKYVAARWLIGLAIPTGWIVILVLLDWEKVADEALGIFIFLGVFPLINAGFDFLSYAVTLTLLRLGLRSQFPPLYGVLDLIAAVVLFLALGLTLTVVIAGMNRLAGVALVDLGALFAGIREDPGQYLWLYAMLFSTILPTAAHFAVSLLGAQGITQIWMRRRIARWVRATPERPLIAALTPFAVGAVWTVPIFLVGVVGFGIWWIGEGVIRGAGDAYYGVLFDVAFWIGAF